MRSLDASTLAVFLSACGCLGSSLVLMYLLVRSRLNGIGWVAVMEPNDLIFWFEVGFLYPFLIVAALVALYGLKKRGGRRP